MGNGETKKGLQMKYGLRGHLVLLLLLIPSTLFPQDKHYYQVDFPVSEFAARRAKVFDAIGSKAFALVQGASATRGDSVFRQSNSFYYLCGLEVSNAYLVLDGRNRSSTLFLRHRDSGEEPGQRQTLAAEDADLIKELTGVNQVRGIEFLSLDLVGKNLIRPPAPILYTPFSPAETGQSRDTLLRGQAGVSSDPWDGNPSREARLRKLLNERTPQFEIRDLSPILDATRLIKSPKEVDLIRKATQIAGLAIIEAMKSTEPGIYEYQLDAVAKYVHYVNGARGEGYASIIGGGSNTLMGHYFRKTDELRDGDFLLMDHAPDYRYYTSDVTRIWPVNGKFSDAQRKLLNYIVAFRDALFRHVRPGVTSDEVLDAAAKDMKEYLVGKTFANAAHLKAVQAGIKFRGHFQHTVGMAVHDVGSARGVELKPGMIFTIDPMIWIREERLYVRIEDMALVTENGVENMSAFVPATPEDIENTMAEKGIIQFHPATSLPLKN